MGFLRKKFKQIKKKVKKLLGGKFGKILGGIGLAMMFWGGANALFGGKGGWFDSFSSKLKDMNPFAKGDVTGAVEKIVQPSDIAGPTLEGQIAQGKEILSPKFKDLPIGDKIKVAGEATKDFLLPDVSSVGEFAADVTRSAGQQYVIGALQGEPEEQTAGFGVMPQVGSFEAPQASYVQEVRNQIPNFQATNFNQLNQSLFYGTLSPQYLMGQMG